MTTLVAGYRAGPLAHATPKVPPLHTAKPVRKKTAIWELDVYDALDYTFYEVCAMLHVERELVRSKARSPIAVLARRLVIVYAHKYIGASYPEITRIIREVKTGHSTSIEAHQAFEKYAHDRAVYVGGVSRTGSEWLAELERRIGFANGIEDAAGPC